MNDFRTRSGRQLYALLPAVYRERDNTEYDARQRIVALGDLAHYLDVCGELLDRMRATLDQRLADAFPDNPSDGAPCQEWLIPYYARLLDVRLVSPGAAGQRDEVANAILWRQGKGTLACAEGIAESISQQEVELQEGWRRVAVTPRVGDKLLPLAQYGVTLASHRTVPVERHPGLPAATLDLRCHSLAVPTTNPSPASHDSRFAGVPQRWLQANPAGVPFVPGSFDDVSRRTVDLRTPSYATGHVHPRRLLAYMPIPYGLFEPSAKEIKWSALNDSPYVVWSYDAQSQHLSVRRRADAEVRISVDVADLLAAFTTSPVEMLTLDGLTIPQSLTVARVRLRLRKGRVGSLTVTRAGYFEDLPALDARDSLIGALRVPAAYATLDSCTVLSTTHCDALVASNCIFAGELIGKDGKKHPSAGRARHSRLPLTAWPDQPLNDNWSVDAKSCTAETPRFMSSSYAPGGNGDLLSDAGVLRPDSPAVICFGAEDDAEMGVFRRGRGSRPVRVERAQDFALVQANGYELTDLIFADALTVRVAADCELRLRRVAASRVEITGASALAMLARDSLFDRLTVISGAGRLEYCTVLGDTDCAVLQASDCIFHGQLTLPAPAGRPWPHCVRYSRVPPAVLPPPTPSTIARFPHCTGVPAVFLDADFDRGVAGHPGCGVLHPTAPAAIGQGAEDGGEMGAYHAHRHVLGRVALRDKLIDHLPLGIEPVIILDARLLNPPSLLPELVINN